MNKNYVKVVLLLCAAGIVLASILLSQHYRLLSSGVLEKSFCTINEYVDCDVVNTSRYAKIGSLPVSGLGIVFYLVIAVFSLRALALAPQKRQGLFFSFLIALAGLAYSAYMAYVSFFIIKALCLMCTGMYAVNLLLALVLPLAMGTGYRGLFPAMRQYFRAAFKGTNTLGFEPKLILHFVIALVLLLGGAFALEASSRAAIQARKPANPQKPSNDPHGHAHPHPGEEPEEIPLDKLLEAHFLQPAVDIDTAGRPALGNPQAGVRIVEFSDFQCPFCRQAALYFKTVTAEFKDDVSFTFVNYPLDSGCNPQIKRPMHPQACNAARTAICANRQGKFWPLHDLIFENQHRLKADSFTELGQMAGLEAASFEACRQSPDTEAALKQDIELAQRLQITGTPSVFVNGRRVGAWSNPEFLKAVLEVELSR